MIPTEAEQASAEPVPDPASRVRFEPGGVAMLAIDTTTGQLADSAMALAALGQLSRKP